MLDLLSLALKVVESGLNLVETSQARSHITKIRKLKLKIRDAEAKPYDEQDDNLIVSLYQEFKIYMEEANTIISSGVKK